MRLEDILPRGRAGGLINHGLYKRYTCFVCILSFYVHRKKYEQTKLTNLNRLKIRRK